MRYKQLSILLSVVFSLGVLGGCATTQARAIVKVRPRPAPAVLQHPRPSGFWEAETGVVQVLHDFSRLTVDDTGKLILDDTGKLTIKTFTAIGTGAVLNVNGLVLTNNHVIEQEPIDLTPFPQAIQPAFIPPDIYKVCIVTAGVSDCYPAEVVYTNPSHDLAWVYTKHHFSHVTKFVDESVLMPGDEVYLWGNVFDLLPPSPLFGRYIRICGPPYYTGTTFSKLLLLPVLLMDINVSAGSSGGPVFDALGRAIGLANGSTIPSAGGRSLGIVIPSSVIMKLQKDHPWSPPKK